MRILAVNPAHDSSVAVYSEKGIEYFCKEERLNKVKRDSQPFKAIDNAIKKFPDIQQVVFASQCYNHESDFWFSYIKSKTNAPIFDLSYDHHLQHASLAFYNSGFDVALTIVIDRNGSYSHNNSCRESESVFVAAYPCDFQPLIKNYWASWSGETQDDHINEFILKYNRQFPRCEVNVTSNYSIVKVYESATSLIGQGHLDSGKTMGLASYGKPSDLPPLFVKGHHPVDAYFTHTIKHPYGLMVVNRDLHNLAVEAVTEENFQLYADYAYHVQQETQKAALSLIKKSIEKTGIKKVCITGGYGLNIVANEYYTRELPDVEFYFEPLADDSGNALGAAMYAYRKNTEDNKIEPINHTFINGENYSIDVEAPKTSIDEICKLILDQKSVAIYQGLAESGPRALGHRSILFDPRNSEAKNIVNKIKNREWYRPFAAMVLEEDADLYFDLHGNTSNKFMTMSYNVRPEKIDKIPGVVHVDNTCRVQTINKDDGVIYELLCKYKQATGESVLLNTSFNLSGMPLVETPADAIFTLENSSLDAIWFAEHEKLLKK